MATLPSSAPSVLSRLRLATLAPSLPAGWLRSLAPVLLLAALLTALALAWLWRDQSGYKPLFGAREKVAASEMMVVLDAEGIPYRIHPDSGQVLVPDSVLGKARMLLAAKGVTARLPAGLELMDRNDPLGVSQFVQDVRFRRGLEGELAQSIMTLNAVESARVHLAVARSSSFVVPDGEKSSASVVLVLKPGRTLGQEQVAAIINMVSGSVANLAPQRVSVVDQAGHLLSSRVDLSDGFEGGTQGLEATRAHEEEVRQKVHALLAPVLGEGNYKLSVTAEVNSDRVQETRESYGNEPRLTNEALREESARDQLALGVPGSLSNRPVNVQAPNPAAAGNNAAAQAGNNANTNAPEGNTAKKNATARQFAYDRTVTQTKRGHGQLAKLNVAVLLNSTAAPAGGAWNAAQLADVERLLRGGLGISDQRGDSLVVSSMAFPAVRTETAPWWEQRDNVIEASSWLAYAVAALLGYLLLARPLLGLAQQRWGRSAAADAASSAAVPALPGSGGGAEPAMALPAAPALALGAGGAAAGGARAGSGSGVAPLLQNYDLPPPGSPVDVMVEHLRLLSARETERVAEVVKQWVQKDG